MKGTPVGNDHRRRTARAAVGTAVAAITLATSAAAHADTIQVKNTKASGGGSFAGAVKAADRDPDRDTISFARRLRGTIKLRNELLQIREPVSIEGRGYGNRRRSSFGRVTLEGRKRGSNIVLDGYVGKGPSNTVKEMNLRRVSLASAGPSLTVKDSYMDGRSTVTGRSGIDGQFVYGSGSEAIRVLGTTVTGFRSGMSLYKSRARVDRSRLSGNVYSGVTAGDYASFEVTNSTISGNGSVGASAVYESGGDVINTTVTGNEGGGTYGVDVNESTVAENGGVGVGGYASDGDSQISNSIVWGNAGGDCGSSVDSLGGNVIGNPGECVLTSTDVAGENPKLGELASNGGPTRTMAIGKGSPAIGRAVRKTATKFDQRGVKRDAHPDAGAYER